MKNITREIIRAFISNNKIELNSTHTKLCIPIINRIYKKMLVGINFSSIKVENNTICDGHHRYIASIIANFPLEKIQGYTTSASTIVAWEKVYFEEEDWDTATKINMLNEQDALFNDIPVKKIVELLR